MMPDRIRGERIREVADKLLLAWRNKTIVIEKDVCMDIELAYNVTNRKAREYFTLAKYQATKEFFNDDTIKRSETDTESG